MFDGMPTRAKVRVGQRNKLAAVKNGSDGHPELPMIRADVIEPGRNDAPRYQPYGTRTGRHMEAGEAAHYFRPNLLAIDD